MQLKLTMSIVFLLIFVGCFDEKQTNKEIKKSPKIVKVINLKSINLQDNTREYPAQIKPNKNEILAFEVPGKIVKFNFKAGEFVKKGDTIALINNDIYKANYNAALSSYKKAKSDFQRADKLYKKRVVSKTNYELSKQAIDVAKSNFNIAKKNLDNSKLIAHFDGIIASKFVEDYEVVAPKQPIASLQDKSSLKVEFNIPQTDIIQAQTILNIEDINQKYDFFVKVGEKSQKTYKAKLTDISTSAEVITRTYSAKVMMKSPKDINLLPGMTAKVIVNLKKQLKKRIFIPSVAIFSDHTKNSYVWLVKDNKVQKRAIKTGTLIENKIEVHSGLEGSENIVISGVNLLEENQKISVYKKLSK